MEALLHVGVEHPNTVWLAVSALVAFVAGIGVARYRSRLSDAIDRLTADSDAE